MNHRRNHESSIARRNRTPRAHDLRASCLQESRKAAWRTLLTRFEHQTLPIMICHGSSKPGSGSTIVGRSEQLTYLLACSRVCTALEEQWVAFESDAEWLAIRKSTEENGPFDLRDRKLTLETNELLSSQMTLCSLAYRSPWQPDALPVQLQYPGGITTEAVAQLQATGA